MTDTIIVALITFASGAFGAGVTAFITWRTAKLSADKELERRRHEEKQLCFSQFVSAYHTLMHQAVLNGKDRSHFKDELTLLVQFQIVYSKAILICDKSSIPPFTKLLHEASEMIKTREFDQIKVAYKVAINTMRKELGTQEQQPSD